MTAALQRISKRLSPTLSSLLEGHFEQWLATAPVPTAAPYQKQGGTMLSFPVLRMLPK